jgi:hypothetical protein
VSQDSGAALSARPTSDAPARKTAAQVGLCERCQREARQGNAQAD